ncbi:MAG: lipopolysaccharide biosynthesis protein [Sphingobacterium sp.]|jgi:O-antigen/teichoic acid export membrane protein|nr:lipopolysaccharide biosynthesis protein [Sphingobacterium sp.]
MSSQTENDSLKSKTTKGLLWGGMASIIQQFLGFGFGILLNRKLTAEDYGLVAMITIFSVLASAFQESGFIYGIVNKKEVQHKDYNAVFWTSVGIGTFIYIVLFFSAPLIALYYNQPVLVELSRFTFLSFWLGSFGIAHNAYLFRNLKIKERVITGTLALILSNTIGIYLAYKDYAYWAFAVQIVSYSGFNMIGFWYFSKFRPTFAFDFSPIRDILGFSSKILVTNVFININKNIYAAILGKHYTTQELGYTVQPNKWSQMAQSILTNMVNNVTQPILREIEDDKDRQVRVFRKLISFTAFLAFPMLFGLTTVAQDFITITITEKWQQSAIFLQIFCIGAAFDSVSNVFSSLIISKGRSQIYMRNIVVFGLLQIAILVFGKSLGIEMLIALTSGLNALWIFVWYASAKPYMTYSFSYLIRDVFSYAALAGISCLAAHYATASIANLYLRFASTIGVAVCTYIIVNRIFKPSILLELFSYFTTVIRKK